MAYITTKSEQIISRIRYWAMLIDIYGKIDCSRQISLQKIHFNKSTWCGHKPLGKKKAGGLEKHAGRTYISVSFNANMLATATKRTSETKQDRLARPLSTLSK